MLNPIRPTALTSLLAKDEVENRSRSEELRQLGDSLGGEPVSTHGREVRVIGDGMAGRHCAVNQGSRSGNSDGVHGLWWRSEEPCPEGDRASVGVKKRSNVRGAKGGRVVEAEEPKHGPKKAGVVPARAVRARDRVPPEQRAMSACLWTKEGERKPCCRITFSSRGPWRLARAESVHRLESRMREIRPSGSGGERRVVSPLLPHLPALGLAGDHGR
jgi:hypothetical protein